MMNLVWSLAAVVTAVLLLISLNGCADNQKQKEINQPKRSGARGRARFAEVRVSAVHAGRSPAL